jgi:hypothetical protein
MEEPRDVAISGLLLLSRLFKPYRSSGNVGATSWVRFGATLCQVMIGHESSLSHLRAKEEGWGRIVRLPAKTLELINDANRAGDSQRQHHQ